MGLLQWGKDKGGINYSTAGYGLLQHLAIEEIAVRTGGKFVHITYKGGAQASVDLVAARVDLGSFAAGSVIPMVRDGKLKAIANVAEKRSALAPEVPTTAEQGFAGLDAGVQFMIYAPGKTPKATVDLLSAELRKVVGDPAMKERFIKIGFDPTPTSSEDMTKLMQKLQADWTPLIKKLGIKLD
jgi:tripartite-type tricarboxylate transporter receptor subunit TctC